MTESGNGKHRATMMPIEVYAARIIAPVITAAMIAIASLLWSFAGRIGRLETLEEVNGKVQTEWRNTLDKRLERMEAKLDALRERP